MPVHLAMLEHASFARRKSGRRSKWESTDREEWYKRSESSSRTSVSSETRLMEMVFFDPPLYHDTGTLLDEQDYEQHVPAHDHQIPPVDLLVPTNESNISMMTEFQYNKASLVVTEEANFWESFSISWLGCYMSGEYLQVCVS